MRLSSLVGTLVLSLSAFATTGCGGIWGAGGDADGGDGGAVDGGADVDGGDEDDDTYPAPGGYGDTTSYPAPGETDDSTDSSDDMDAGATFDAGGFPASG